MSSVTTEKASRVSVRVMDPAYGVGGRTHLWGGRTRTWPACSRRWAAWRRRRRAGRWSLASPSRPSREAARTRADSARWATDTGRWRWRDSRACACAWWSWTSRPGRARRSTGSAPRAARRECASVSIRRWRRSFRGPLRSTCSSCRPAHGRSGALTVRAIDTTMAECSCDSITSQR